MFFLKEFFEYFNQQRKNSNEKPGARIDGRKKEEVSPILIHLTIYFFVEC